MSLTDTAITKAKPKDRAYKVADSQGLYLLVNPNGSKLWRVKYRIDRVERKLALGSYPEITLAEARAARDAARKHLAHSIDPNVAKRQARIEASICANNSFASVAQELIDKKAREGLAEPTLEKMRWFVKLLGTDFGKRPVSAIKPQELLHELRKHERRGRLETANLLRAFASRVFRYAVATARAESDPAQLLIGALTSAKVKHFAAITDPTEFGTLLRVIEDYQGDPSVIYALKLTPHLFQRPGELRQMEWTEVDFDKAVWTIPVSKMKMRQTHSVPLSRQSLAILEEMRSLSGSGRYVFPSIRTLARPISDNTINAALRRMGYLALRTSPRAYYCDRDGKKCYVSRRYFCGALRGLLLSEDAAVRAMALPPGGLWFFREIRIEAEPEDIIAALKMKPRSGGRPRQYDHAAIILSVLEHPKMRSIEPERHGSIAETMALIHSLCDPSDEHDNDIPVALIDWRKAERPPLASYLGEVSFCRIDGPRQWVDDRSFPLSGLILSPGVTAHLNPFEARELHQHMRRVIEQAMLAWVTDHELYDAPRLPAKFDRRMADRKAKAMLAQLASRQDGAQRICGSVTEGPHHG